MDLRRLNIGKHDLSVDALKVALEQVESGFLNKHVSVRSIRIGALASCVHVTTAISNYTLFASPFSGTEPMHITHLNLGQNGIRCRGIAEISQALRCMKHLQILDLSGNKLGCVGWNALSEVLAASKHLLELRLSGNFVQHIDPAPVASVPTPGRTSPAPLDPASAPAEGEGRRCHKLCVWTTQFKIVTLNYRTRFSVERCAQNERICCRRRCQCKVGSFVLQQLRFECGATRFDLCCCMRQCQCSNIRCCLL
jgi:hypothetical protein